MYHVYILLNEAGTRTYTGVADDVNKRLADHNAGRVKSSHPYRPYKILRTESFATLSEARQKEKFYKSTTGRRRLKEMLVALTPSATLSHLWYQ
jgi:putative endonuclease